MSLYLISETLGLFVDTLTADDMYSWGYRENFTQLIQMQLSKKPKAFSQTFIAFLKFTKAFEHFGKKLSIIASVFLYILAPTKAVI